MGNTRNSITISACLIVRDEGAHGTRDADPVDATGVGSDASSSLREETILDRCLSSLRGVADEIIIVDTGSVDNTKEIASRYTDKIYDFEWCDDFSAARNFANSKATGDWILTIDADEYIPEENRPLYKQAVKAVEGSDYIMIMPRIYMMGGDKPSPCKFPDSIYGTGWKTRPTLQPQHQFERAAL